jgi:hypothetical protein
VKLHTSSPSSYEETETSKIGFLDGGEEGAGETAAASLAPKVGEHVKLEPYSLNFGSLEETETGVESTGEAGQAAGALANSANGGGSPWGN